MVVRNLRSFLESLPITEGSSKMNRAMRIMTSGHFAILTSWRSYQTIGQDVKTNPELRIAQDRDRKLLVHFGGSPATANRESYKDLIRRLNDMGLGPIRATGIYQELGAPLQAEASLVVPGNGRLTRDLAVKIGRRYNQDAIIYCGPETKGKIIVYTLERSSGGVFPDTTLGDAEVLSASSIKNRMGSIGRDAPAFASTQPVRRTDAPGGKQFGKRLGTGGGVTLKPL